MIEENRKKSIAKRIELLVKAIERTRVTFRYDPSALGKIVIEDAMRLNMMLGGDFNFTVESGNIRISNRDMFITHEVSAKSLSNNLTKWNDGKSDFRTYFINGLSVQTEGGSLVREISGISKLTKPNLYNDCTDDENKTAIEISKILILHNCYNYKRKNIAKYVEMALMDYLDTGKRNWDVFPEIIPNDKKTWQNPILSVSDEGNGLVFKYKKYCPGCGKLMSGCYCEDVSCIDLDMNGGINIQPFSDGGCRDCAIERILKAIENTGRVDSNSVDYYDDCLFDGLLEAEELKDYHKSEGADVYIDPSVPKELLVKIINEEWDNYDGDAPDDMCACPMG